MLIGFVIMGALAGLAGVLGAARLNSAVVNAGVGIELKVITATVLGGASLKGGEGHDHRRHPRRAVHRADRERHDHQRHRRLLAGLVVGLVLLFAVSLDRFKTGGRV